MGEACTEFHLAPDSEHASWAPHSQFIHHPVAQAGRLTCLSFSFSTCEMAETRACLPGCED